jgi:branched-chain amino acid transport system permease protein
MSCLWALITSSLNLVAGYTGMISLAQVGLAGIGAYSSAILMLRYGLVFWTALPLASILSALFGVLIGLISTRIKGMHFAITTLMIGMALYVIFLTWRPVTGGYVGLTGIPRPSCIRLPFIVIDFHSVVTWYFFIAFLTLAIVTFLHKLVKSDVGRIFVAIREDELLLSCTGINTNVYKVLSFFISGFLCGLVGSIYAHYFGYISPEAFGPWCSLEILLFMTFGGSGTILGPIIGTFLLKIIFELFHFLAQVRLIICGAVIILTLKYMPAGIYPWFKEKIMKYLRMQKSSI